MILSYDSSIDCKGGIFMTVREMRKSLGLSQKEFAAYFDIPIGNIQHWEQGVSNPPKYVLKMMNRILDLEKPEKGLVNG